MTPCCAMEPLLSQSVLLLQSLSYCAITIYRIRSSHFPSPRSPSFSGMGERDQAGVHPWGETRSEGGCRRSLKDHCTAGFSFGESLVAGEVEAGSAGEQPAK